jgi:hypothetical protein
MVKKLITSFLFLIIVFVPPLKAQNQSSSVTVIGKYAGEFMAIGVGGRALGMGGAYVAVANDVLAGYYNPAGLARIDYPEISLMHDERYGSLVNYDYAAVAIPYGKDMSFGLSIMRLGVDGIPDTRQALVDPNTGKVIYDINSPSAVLDYNLITEFSNQDWVIYFSFAKKQSDKFYFGANTKVIYESLGQYNAWGIGFDLGAQYLPFNNFTLGANIQDLTTTLVAWNTGRNELITPTLKVGAAYQLDILGGIISPALDLDIRFENREYASYFHLGSVSFDSHVGLEYNYKNIFMVRGGYNDVKQFTIGAGIKLPKLNIDYSFARFSAAAADRLPDTHRISLMLSLEELKFKRPGS